MKTEPGGISSRSPSWQLDMDGPSMRTVKLGEDGPCVACGATVHVGVRTVPGGPGQAALRGSTQEAVVRVARAYSTEAPGPGQAPEPPGACPNAECARAKSQTEWPRPDPSVCATGKERARWQGEGAARAEGGWALAVRAGDGARARRLRCLLRAREP
eukprot:scaffold52458_cov69-Phaeocystis_antarctica.AAC.1